MKFDLTKKRPQVLVTGNGLTYSVPWNELINKIARKPELAMKYSCDNYTDIPYSLRSLVVGDIEDEIRHNKYLSQLKEIEYSENGLVDSVLTLGFDAILTTNYTHEYEYSLKEKYPQLSTGAMLKYARGKKKNDRFFLETYTSISEKSPEIWHIHGDMRNKSSIVLSHDEYARLIKAILDYLKENGRRYERDMRELSIKSWIDYFMVADVYILGLGFDFSEFDLWWLLNRRLREKCDVGKMIFYEPEQIKSISKINVLSDLQVEVRHLGAARPETQNRDMLKEFYDGFYKKALIDIHTEMQ